MTKIHVNSFVKRQTPESEFSHFEGTWEHLEALVESRFDSAKPGYREGVVLVSLDPRGYPIGLGSWVHFFSGVVTLDEGMTLVGSFKARREGETPRKSVHAQRIGASAYNNCDAHVCPKPSAFAGIAWQGDMTSVKCTECKEVFHDTVAEKLSAKSVDVVLYASTVLAEEGSNELPAEEGNWEIISVNASPIEGEMPINPDVLMHNHFGSDGGTETGLSDEDFVKMLRESFQFWKDKAMIAAKE